MALYTIWLFNVLPLGGDDMSLLCALQGSLMVWMAAHAPDAAMAAVVTAIAALWWPDEAMANAAAFCRYADLSRAYAACVWSACQPG